MKENKHILIYIFFAFLFGWALQIIPILIGGTAVMTVSLILCMWAPALAFFLTKKISRGETKFFATFRPNLKGNIPSYLAAWFLPFVFAVIGGTIYFLIFRGEFDPAFSYMSSMAESTGTDVAMPYPLMFLIQVISGLTFGPLINTFAALGEEIGWRGFLYPALKERFSMTTSAILTGIIWGVWHMPINTMIGYNYGVQYPGFPFTGILAMCVFCFSFGTLQSFLVEKTGSIWTAAIMHGAINAIAGTALMVQNVSYVNGAHTIFGPGINGMIACAPALVVAVILLKSKR